MSAVTGPGQARRPDDHDRILQAVSLRDEWLAAALSADPADRNQTEAAVSELYRLIHLPPPRFEWAPSPAAAVELVRANGRKFPSGRIRAADVRQWDAESAGARLATLVDDLRRHLDDRGSAAGDRFRWSWNSSALMYSPEEAVAAGVNPQEILEATVFLSLRGTLRDAIAAPLRAALSRAEGDADNIDGAAIGRPWYGQHEAYWIAHYDIQRVIGMDGYDLWAHRQLDLWVTLARSAGWWWPGEGLCVLTERPAAISTEPTLGSLHGGRRLHRADGQAVTFPDGYGIHVLHGTPVPEWVIAGPTVDLIKNEKNIEVRRSAIERIGWDTYIEQANLSLVAACPDPGNPGADLALYGNLVGSRSEQVLLVVNGTPEPDGHRRRYGINVPAIFDDPVQAAGWTYGISGTQYRTLARRT